MSATLENVRRLIQKGEVRVSEHGYDELSVDQILIRVIVEGAVKAIVVDDYPNYPKGPCVLVLQRDEKNNPIHVVWGIPKGYNSPAVLVTAYKPDTELWESDYMRRHG